MKNIRNWLGIRACAAALFALGLHMGMAAPRPPLPPWPEIYLYQWSFDEPYAMPELLAPSVSSAGKRTAEAPGWVESWNGYALNRQERQSQVIQLPMKAENGYPMVANGTGTLRFWFCPSWTSGQGPGQEARLLEMVTGSGKGSVEWWALRVSADGAMLQLSAQTEKGFVDLAQGQIQWQAGKWHLVTLGYTPTNTVILVDAQVLAEGSGLPEIPVEAQRLSGLIIGSDAVGAQSAKGKFDELTTFHYPYPNWLLGVYYRAHRRQADLGAIETETGRGGGTIQATAIALEDLEPPGGGGGDTNAVVPVYPLATNGLRLVVASLTNNAMTVTILGGTNNAVYDFFATAALVGSGGTNCTWTWLGQGMNSNNYSITIQTNLQTVFLLGAPQDSDVDGLTDAYEKLVSHTNPSISDCDGDGLPDLWEVQHGLNPLVDDAGADPNGDDVTNYQHFLAGTDPRASVTFALAISQPVGQVFIP